MPNNAQRVFIVEMLPEADYVNGLAEGERLRGVVTGLGFQCPPVERVTEENGFNRAIRNVSLYGVDKPIRGPRIGPFLHVSAHGYLSGVQCTGIALNRPNNGREYISWEELRQILIPVYQAVGDWLVLCMSACCGEAFNDYERGLLINAGDDEDVGQPYYAYVCSGEALRPDTFRDVFEAFYTEAASGARIDNIVAGANRRLGGEVFFAYIHPSWGSSPGI